MRTIMILAASILMSSSAMAATAYIKSEPAVEVRTPVVENRTEYRTEYQQYQDFCSYTVAIPASLSSSCNANSNEQERFDDFASGCKIEPARNEVRQEPCMKTRSVSVPYTTQVTTYKVSYTCPYERFVNLKQRSDGTYYCSLLK